eukprot:5649231-Prymnesium_polylepis.1
MMKFSRLREGGSRTSQRRVVPHEGGCTCMGASLDAWDGMVRVAKRNVSWRTGGACHAVVIISFKTMKVDTSTSSLDDEGRHEHVRDEEGHRTQAERDVVGRLLHQVVHQAVPRLALPGGGGAHTAKCGGARTQPSEEGRTHSQVWRGARTISGERTHGQCAEHARIHARSEGSRAACGRPHAHSHAHAHAHVTCVWVAIVGAERQEVRHWAVQGGVRTVAARNMVRSETSKVQKLASALMKSPWAAPPKSCKPRRE